MSEELRARLCQAGLILAHEGQGDQIWGHVAVRTPDDPSLIFMKPASIGLEEMTAENLITVSLDGDKVAGSMPRHLEVFIHTEVLKRRPEVQAVVHTHAVHAVVFSSLDRPLLPIGHSGSLFFEDLPVFLETGDLIITPDLGARVAATLGDSSAMLLRNHGIVTVGRTIEEAVFFAVNLETACQFQVLAEAAGGARIVSSADEARSKKALFHNPTGHRQVFDYLARRAARRITTPAL